MIAGPAPVTSPDPAALADACRGHGLRTAFQPIVDTARGVVAGYEALVRFDAAPTNPELWFAAARAAGCEAELEAAVLRAALAHRPDLPPNCFLSVNVSPSVLARPAVRAVWRDAGGLGGLVVELTEQSPVESYTALEPDLDALRGAGALIAVDDAGSGYAGLRHLVNLRPSIIKLDRDLVTDIDIDEVKRALAEMVGTFAGRIDAWLLAEGVERVGELEALADLGVPLVQGFYLARPAAPWAGLDPDAARWLARRAPSRRHETLAGHLTFAPAAHDVRSALALFARPGVETVVLLDRFERPVAALGADAAALGVVRPGMRVNVETPVPAAAARAITRDAGERFGPLLCTDDAGRYVGIVRMERLVDALATPHDHTGGAPA